MNNVHFIHAPVFSVLDSKMLVVSIRTIQKEEKKEKRKTLYRTPAQNEATTQTSRLERQTVQTETTVGLFCHVWVGECVRVHVCLCVCVRVCECACACVYAVSAVEVKYGNVFF